MTNSEIENRVAESEGALEEAIEEFNSAEDYVLQNLINDSPSPSPFLFTSSTLWSARTKSRQYAPRQSPGRGKNFVT